MTPAEIFSSAPPSLETGLYLDLLRRCLTREIFDDEASFAATSGARTWKGRIANATLELLRHRRVEVLRKAQSRDDKIDGIGWPQSAEAMCGSVRLECLQRMLYVLEREAIPGDLFDGGCWRGGGVIMMMAWLHARRDEKRLVWAADSFEGYPAPNATSTQDDIDLFEENAYFRVSPADLKANLDRYDANGPELRVLEGYFDKSLPRAPIERLGVIRIDIDGYEGVHAILENLYPKLSPGGFVLIDDYLAIGARRAVDEYVAKLSPKPVIQFIPQKRKTKGAYFRRER